MSDKKLSFGPKQYRAGTDIIRQGDEPDNFYIIIRGTVAIIYQPPDGLDDVLNTLGPGDYFGEVGMLRHSRRMATVRALTDVDVMAMDHRTFNNWIESSPEIADELDSVIEQRLLSAVEAPEPLSDDLAKGMLAYLRSEKRNEGRAVDDNAQQFDKGEVIIRQGDRAETFYIILDGFVTVSHTDDKGREQIITHLTSGNYFGEIGLLEGSARIANITALTDVKVVCFDRDTFKKWMLRSPSSQDELQREAARRRRDTGLLTQSDDA